MSKRQARTDRRTEIADAGIRIIATRGVRALTHRAIDTELALAAGSTSYYARTRRDLVTLIVQRLAARTSADMSGVPLPAQVTVSQAAAIIARGLDHSMQRADEHIARIALHIEYHHNAEMVTALAGDPPIRPRLIIAAESLLTRLGADEPGRHAPDLVALMDSLLMQRVVRGIPLNIEEIMRAYLAGILTPPTL